MKKKILIIVLVILTFVLTACSIKKPVIDRTSYSNSEVQAYLEESCEFSADTDNSSPYGIYKRSVVIWCKDSDVWIMKITTKNDKLNMVIYAWNLDTLNDGFAYIKDVGENKTEDKKAQYKEYEKWLKENGLSNIQIIDLLDYYDNNN